MADIFDRFAVNAPVAVIVLRDVTSSPPDTDARRLRKAFQDELPYPVAIPYKRICACVDNDEKRLRYVVKTAEMVGRLLAIVALCEVRRQFKGEGVPECGPRQDFRRAPPSSTPARARPERQRTCYADGMASRPLPNDRGPFRAELLRSGDCYELSRGHPLYCSPTGGSGSGPNALGASVVLWDPAVREAGVDTGYSPEPGTLRAPDVAVGNVPDKPGWVEGAPELAIEYADVGQDEDKLQEKIADLLAAGAKLVWVVRLTGPRRVEVYEPGRPMRTALPGQEMTAEGVLANPVPVEALYDRSAAERATLRNLLQRRGYDSLEAVLAQGRVEGLREAVRDLCAILEVELPPEREAALLAMGADELDALRARLKRERRWA